MSTGGFRRPFFASRDRQLSCGDDMSSGRLLSVNGVSKAYAGARALTDVSFALDGGDVHALVGENGAGKSTLMNIISGAVAPDSGWITLAGQRAEIPTPRAAKRLGIVAIHQQPALFPDLTVSENIALGSEQASPWQRVNWRERRRRAIELLERVGAQIDPDADARQLSMPEQQLVEIARAVGVEARVLILDEPTASLSQSETASLFRVLRELQDQGTGIIYISHRLEELPAIATRVTVLRDGKTVGTRDMRTVTQAQLIDQMVGRELSSVYPKRAVQLGAAALELRGLGCTASGVSDVSMSVRSGEILGVAGLMGAGRTELARAIFGLEPANEGEMLLGGIVVRIRQPGDAIAHGVAYVPEDRRRHGVVTEMGIAQNITLASLPRVSHRGFLDFGMEQATAADYVERLAVKMDSLFAPVSNLSGGNQQKVALARWLATEPRVLILDEPTQGVDVGAKAEIHSLIGALASKGTAIVMISSDLPELLGMSDRIAVMRGGRMVAMVDGPDATQARILALALGVAAAEPVDMPAADV